MANSNARILRRNMTDAERALWHRIRYRQSEGHRFRRQVPIGLYIVDFACLEAHLVVEVDGGQHDNAPEDSEREAWLALRGYRTMRFWNNEVLGSIDGVLTRLVEALRTRHPNPPPQGGGNLR